MNFDDAIHAITKRGFTVRQAQFLILVARHSGVCVMRQSSTFAGIVFGQKTRKFFDKLVRSGFVSTYDCAHGRRRVYHVRHRAIYEAIGVPDSRLRRPPGVPRALERLMLLDAVQLNLDSVWLSSRAEKVEYFSKRGIATDNYPHRTVRQGDQQLVRPFPDLLPIGVHPSGHVVFVYLYADPSISFSPQTDPNAVLGWCATGGADSVAIDAPPAHSKGLARVGNRRVAEERLGIGGCYGTPRLGSPLPPWMSAGMRCHAAVSATLGEPSVDLTGSGRVFEVHPTYGFRSLLGVHEQADRVRCDPDALLRPKAPRGSTGHVQRVEILRLLLESFGVRWTPALSEKLLARIDWTDAAVGAALAALRAQGATQGVGNATEGTIVIASPTVLGVLACNIRDAVAGLCASRRPTAHSGTRSRSVVDDAEGALLRLGVAGLGVLTQNDTLEALRGQQSEGEIVLPAGVIAIGRQWIERAATTGFWLLVAFGRLKLALHVVEIIGKGRTETTPKEMVLGANRDPWPGIEQSEYWLRCDQLLDDLDVPLNVVSTRQEGQWTVGVPRNQSAWLAVRINDGPLREQLQGR